MYHRLCPGTTVWGSGTPEREWPHAKRQGLFQGGVHEQPNNPHSHSPCISGSTTLNKNAQRNTLNPDPWARLNGRANEEQIVVNGISVTALLDLGAR